MAVGASLPHWQPQPLSSIGGSTGHRCHTTTSSDAGDGRGIGGEASVVEAGAAAAW